MIVRRFCYAGDSVWLGSYKSISGYCGGWTILQKLEHKLSTKRLVLFSQQKKKIRDEKDLYNFLCWEMKFLKRECWIHVFKTLMLHNKIQISRHHFIAAPHPEERACWPLHCIHKGCRLTTPLLPCMVQLGHSTEALHLACFAQSSTQK